MGAAGLIFPAAFGVAPVLVPIAAVGFAIQQTAAAFVHIRRDESKLVIANLVFIGLALFVAWGRFGDYAF